MGFFLRLLPDEPVELPGLVGFWLDFMREELFAIFWLANFCSFVNSACSRLMIRLLLIFCRSEAYLLRILLRPGAMACDMWETYLELLLKWEVSWSSSSEKMEM